MARSWSPLLMALERAKKISKYTQESHQMRIWIRIRIRIRMPEFGTWIWAMVCGVWGLGAAESPCQLFAFCHGKLDSWKRSLNCTWPAFRGGRFCIFAFLHFCTCGALRRSCIIYHSTFSWTGQNHLAVGGTAILLSGQSIFKARAQRNYYLL